MKKFVTILAIAFVSLNFVSCRQDDAASDMEVNVPQAKTAFNKDASAATDTLKTGTVKRAIDPDPPVKDGTSW